MLYMETGTGKTITSLSCGIRLLTDKKVEKIVVMTPKSIQTEFLYNFNEYCTMIDINDRQKNEFSSKIVYMCYNSGKTYSYFNALKDKDNTLYIIDEAHLFMRSILKANIPDEKLERLRRLPKTIVNDDEYISRGNCKKVYDEMIKLHNSYFFLLTGTPSAKTPFENIPMFNLSPQCNLEMAIDIFTEKYFNADGSINNANKTELIHNLNGLIAHVGINDELQQLKATPLIVKEVEMSYKQYKHYLDDYSQELKEKGYIRHVNTFGWGFGQISSFHAKTFGDSIYVNCKDISLTTDQPLSNIIINKDNCPKILTMFNDAEAIHGKCCMYFRFVDRGVNTMRKCLEMNGYTMVGRHENVYSTPGKRYVVFTGENSAKVNAYFKQLFNDKRNMYGDYIKYILLSPAGSVGLTLKCVRYLGIGCVEYNISAIRQVQGRCNRLNSHVDLPVKDRTLVNYIYLAVSNKEYIKKHYNDLDSWYNRTAPDHDEKFPSIERCIYQDALYDDKLNDSFRQVLKDVSVV